MAERGPLSGQMLGGRYLLGEVIGEGGFGMVYAARHLLLDRPQAIKVLLPHHFSKPKFRERFLREARTVATLDHPHIVHVDDFGMEEQELRAYLVMPFIGGGTFQDILQKRQEPLNLEQVMSYLEQVCGALDYAHQRGVAHLDLKPLNLLVHEDGRLLLSDFGLAHLLKQEVLEGGTSLQHGSPHYMAPEHIRGHPGRASDVYALGVILYQMLVKQRPFEGDTPEAVMIKHLTEQPLPLRMVRPGLPPEFEEVMERALAKQIAHRYPSAGQLLESFKIALDRVQEQALRAKEERFRRTAQERVRKAEEERARKAEEERARKEAMRPPAELPWQELAPQPQQRPPTPQPASTGVSSLAHALKKSAKRGIVNNLPVSGRGRIILNAMAGLTIGLILGFLSSTLLGFLIFGTIGLLIGAFLVEPLVLLGEPGPVPTDQESVHQSQQRPPTPQPASTGVSSLAHALKKSAKRGIVNNLPVSGRGRIILNAMAGLTIGLTLGFLSSTLLGFLIFGIAGVVVGTMIGLAIEMLREQSRPTPAGLVACVDGKAISQEFFSKVCGLKYRYTKDRYNYLATQVQGMEQKPLTPELAVIIKFRRAEMWKLQKQLNDLQRSNMLEQTVLEELVSDVLIQQGIDEAVKRRELDRMDLEQRLTGDVGIFQTYEVANYLALLSRNHLTEQDVLDVLQVFVRRNQFAWYLYEKYQESSIEAWLERRKKSKRTKIKYAIQAFPVQFYLSPPR